MTPANVSATPAAVFPGMTAPVTPARDVFDRLMEDLTVTRATLDGVVALIQSSRFTDQDEALCHARTLGWQCLERLRVTYNTIDEASIAEFHRNKKLPQQDSEASPPTPLAVFGETTCQRAGTIASVVLSAKALIENHDRDQESEEVFQACQVLAEAAKLAHALSGDALNVATAKSAS